MDYEEIIKAIRNDKLYDFIANNFYKMDKEQLRDIILELYYMIRYDYVYGNDNDEKILNENIVECLKENREWEE